MAGAAVSGRPFGVDIRGYRDYRGVRVLGAWIWDPELQIGIASEIDEKEALTGFMANRRIALAFLGLIAVLTAALVGVVLVSPTFTAKQGKIFFSNFF